MPKPTKTPLRAALVMLRGGSDTDISALSVRVVGWILTCGAMGAVAELVRKRSAPESMSSTMSLQLLGFGMTVVCHTRMGYPLSTFAEFAVLGAQSPIILALCMFYRRRVSAVWPLCRCRAGSHARCTGSRPWGR